MTRAEMIRDYFGVDYDWLICRDCVSAILSRGEKIMATESYVIDMDEIEQFAEDEGFEDTEGCGCEWCGEIDNLYGVIFR